MATPGTMRPLAPAKSSAHSSRTSSPASTPQRPHNVMPAKLAPASSSRPLKPLLAAKPSNTSVQQRPLLASNHSSAISAPSSSSSSARKLPALAPLVPLAPSKAATPSTSSSQRKPPTIKAKIVPPKSSVAAPKLQPVVPPPSDETASSSASIDSAGSSTGSHGDRYGSASPAQSASAATPSDHTSDKVQPKKEWILPARAKPGRKPSDIEPPTKRKAQNRASQRAFRERRQSYVASLEAKVAEYERKGANVSSELQRVARRLKDENDALKASNATLRAKMQRMEAALAMHGRGEPPMVKMEDGLTPVTVQGPGSMTDRRGSGMSGSMLLPDERRQSWDWTAMAEREKSRSPPPPPDVEMGNTSETGMHRDCGFCTEQSPCVCSGEAVLDFNTAANQQNDCGGANPSASTAVRTSASTSTPTVVPLRAHLKRQTSADNKARLWYTEPARTAQPQGIRICPTPRDRVPFAHHQTVAMQRMRSSSQAGSVQFHPMHSGNMLPPLHFANRPKPKLWPVYPTSVSPVKSYVDRGGMPPSPGTMRAPNTPPIVSSTVQPTVFRMRKQQPGGPAPVCSGDPSDCSACATDPALADFCRAVSSHLGHGNDGDPNGHVRGPVILDTGNALPLRRKRTRSGSMADARSLRSNEVAAAKSLAPLSLYTNGTDARSNGQDAFGHPSAGRPKLWTLSRNSYQGDLSHISLHRAARTPPSPSAAPCLRRHTSSDVVPPNEAGSVDGVESIPEAWQRIKKHPSFAQWQGGLDMLADVVTRKSDDDGSSAGSGKDASQQQQEQEQEQEHEQGQESEQRQHTPHKQHRQEDEQRASIAPSPSSLAEKFWRGSSSSDRAPDSGKRMDVGDEMGVADTDAGSANKRRKLYVERKRVDDVLALMDRATPTLSAARSNSDSGHSASPTADQHACACPLSKIM